MEVDHEPERIWKMTYENLKVGMRLMCDQKDGTQKELIVARKGIDGFGKESVVFQSATSMAQFYCRAEHIPLWHIRIV